MHWFSRRALLLHLVVLLLVPTFLGLFWWQVQRVREGNTLSWAYVFEWPFFAAYAIYLWWRLVHEEPDHTDDPTVDGAHDDAGHEEDRDQDEDDELAAYNRYLAELDANGRPKRW